jgi:Rho termination factor, N-terminal domain
MTVNRLTAVRNDLTAGSQRSCPQPATGWFALANAGKNERSKEVTMPRAPIKDEKTYQKLRDKGESKNKAARIANAAAGSSRSTVGRKGGKSGSYDDWSKKDLVEKAREIGIKGRSTMSKSELIKALRNH